MLTIEEVKFMLYGIELDHEARTEISKFINIQQRKMDGLEKENKELKQEIDTLINCENCRHESDDHNSECDSC